jgi:hypothetical protein
MTRSAPFGRSLALPSLILALAVVLVVVLVLDLLRLAHRVAALLPDESVARLSVASAAVRNQKIAFHRWRDIPALSWQIAVKSGFPG